MHAARRGGQDQLRCTQCSAELLLLEQVAQPLWSTAQWTEREWCTQLWPKLRRRFTVRMLLGCAQSIIRVQNPRAQARTNA